MSFRIEKSVRVLRLDYAISQKKDKLSTFHHLEPALGFT